VACASGYPVLKMRTSADSSQPEEASLESCFSASCAHGTTRTEAQCLRVLACLATYNFPCVLRGSVPGAPSSPAPKIRMSAERSQPEKARLESCCSASSAHGTARTEAQRLGLLACLATSNFQRRLGCPWLLPPLALHRKCKRLQVALSQKGLAYKAILQPHLPNALLEQKHRDGGFLLVLPPTSSSVD